MQNLSERPIHIAGNPQQMLPTAARAAELVTGNQALTRYLWPTDGANSGQSMVQVTH